MLAFRRATPVLRAAAGTRFLDLPDPVLGFVRGSGEAAHLCLFNLSPTPVSLSQTGVEEQVGPRQSASFTADKVGLGPNGYGFFRVMDGFTLKAG
jgi:alpha-glucosidase